MAEHDLIHKVSPFCDPHLLVQADGPLDFLLGQAEYFPQEDISKAKVALLAQTKNVSTQRRGGRCAAACLCVWAVVYADRSIEWTHPHTPFSLFVVVVVLVALQVDGQIRAMEELYGDDFQPPEGTCVCACNGWGRSIGLDSCCSVCWCVWRTFSF